MKMGKRYQSMFFNCALLSTLIALPYRSDIAVFVLHSSHIDGIMEGLLTLIDIHIPDTIDLLPTIAKDEMSEQMYSGIAATFCHVSWELHNDEKMLSKASLSTFLDLQKASALCPGTTVSVDLWDIVQQLRKYDVIHGNSTNSVNKKQTVNVVHKPTAVIFHESKSGSTVISNALSVFATPHHTRVYAEATPPLIALHACELHTTIPRRCAKESHVALIQDVFYVMGRVSRSMNPGQPQYIFHKVHSTGVQSIDAFVSAMPSTPWAFAYRNSVEVLMSHFPQYLRPSESLSQFSFLPSTHDDSECLKNYGKPESQQPPLVVELIGKANKQLSQLTREEYCAAHIAGLATAAIREHDKTVKLAVQINAHAVEPIRGNDGDASNEQHNYIAAPPHFFLNYNTLPHSIWESFLPSLVLQHSIDNKDIVNMRKAASMKIQQSKALKPQTTEVQGEHWIEDSTLKHGMAPLSIQNAVRLFLAPVYEQMEAIRLKHA
jgi:hypothetical protein